MLSSGDSLLLSLLIILVPALFILVGTFIYSRTLLRRYSRVLRRLYRTSFKGVDTERKRIARELHDELGVHWVVMNQHFNRLKSDLTGENREQLLRLENEYHLFKDKTHQIVEFMYPKGLSNPDWDSSFKSLALQMSMGEVIVSYESDAEKYPTRNSLHHAYWAVQEIVTNAVKHAHVKRVQVTSCDDDDQLSIIVVYRATQEAIAWAKGTSSTKNGYGILIIEDRLNIIGGRQKINVQDGVLSHIISIPYGNSDS
jgi:two-component system, NarL family, sensor histidine kinase UhpB